MKAIYTYMLISYSPLTCLGISSKSVPLSRVSLVTAGGAGVEEGRTEGEGEEEEVGADLASPAISPLPYPQESIISLPPGTHVL